MTKWLIGAAAFVVAALMVMLWRGVASDVPAPASGTRSSAPTRRPMPSAAAPTAAPTLAAKPAAQVDDDDPRTLERAPAPEPNKEVEEREAIERFVSDAVVRELYAEASGCYRDQPGQHEAVVVGYALRVQDGVATVRDASLISSELGDRGLEDCIVETVDGHSWQVADGFSVNETGQKARFTVVGLKKRSRAAARASETEDPVDP